MIKKAIAFLPILLIISYSSGICQSQDSTVVIRKTNPTGALLRSAFVPGWGQFYNRKYIKATIFAAGESWLAIGIYNDWKKADRHRKNFQSSTDPIYQALEFNKFQDFRDSRNLKMWILAAGVFYSMFDAYVDAQLSDFNQTDKSFEAYIGPGRNNGIEVSLTFTIP